jgi:hypothetical protein
MKEILVGQIQWPYVSTFFPASLLGVCAGYCQEALVGESGFIRTQMGKHNRSVMVAMYGMPCAIPPHKQ